MTTTARKEKTFPLIAFDIEAVARVTGLTVRMLLRWDRTGFFHPWKADPNRRRPGSRIYSRDDVVALGFIARLREAGVPLGQIKPILHLLAPNENRQWPARIIHLAGNRLLFLSQDEATASANQSGQKVEPTTIDLALVLTDIEEAIERLRERRPEEIGQVVRRRGVMRGVPIIAGTRIPTETIAWFHDNGYSLADILENFPRLTPKDVEAAVAFENEREAKIPDPVLAYR